MFQQIPQALCHFMNETHDGQCRVGEENLLNVRNAIELTASSIYFSSRIACLFLSERSVTASLK